MPTIRYSIRDVLWCVTLIAAGLGLFLAAGQIADAWKAFLIGVLGWFGGWALIGAGCGALFQVKVFGAVVGLCCGLIVLIALFFYLAPQFHSLDFYAA